MSAPSSKRELRDDPICSINSSFRVLYIGSKSTIYIKRCYIHQDISLYVDSWDIIKRFKYNSCVSYGLYSAICHATLEWSSSAHSSWRAWTIVIMSLPVCQGSAWGRSSPSSTVLSAYLSENIARYNCTDFMLQSVLLSRALLWHVLNCWDCPGVHQSTLCSSFEWAGSAVAFSI